MSSWPTTAPVVLISQRKDGGLAGDRRSQPERDDVRVPPPHGRTSWRQPAPSSSCRHCRHGWASARPRLEQMGGFQPSASYQASKAAIEGLAVHLAGRGGEHGVRVNGVRPGRIMTARWASCSRRTASFGLRIQMLKRQGSRRGRRGRRRVPRVRRRRVRHRRHPQRRRRGRRRSDTTQRHTGGSPWSRSRHTGKHIVSNLIIEMTFAPPVPNSTTRNSWEADVLSPLTTTRSTRRPIRSPIRRPATRAPLRPLLVQRNPEGRGVLHRCDDGPLPR